MSLKIRNFLEVAFSNYVFTFLDGFLLILTSIVWFVNFHSNRLVTKMVSLNVAEYQCVLKDYYSERYVVRGTNYMYYETWYFFPSHFELIVCHYLALSEDMLPRTHYIMSETRLCKLNKITALRSFNYVVIVSWTTRLIELAGKNCLHRQYLSISNFERITVWENSVKRRVYKHWWFLWPFKMQFQYTLICSDQVLKLVP